MENGRCANGAQSRILFAHFSRTFSVLFQPVSEIFPLMTGDAFDGLVADIKANGLREAIWLHEQKIIDGRNRYLACRQCGQEPRFREWDKSGSLVSFVVSLNLHRRQLNESQRAIVGAKIANMSVGDNQYRGAGRPLGLPAISQPMAANLGIETSI